MNLRDKITKELIILYKRDKIREHLGAKATEDDVDKFYKKAIKNPKEMDKVCGFVLVEDSTRKYMRQAFFDSALYYSKKKVKKLHVNKVERIHTENILTISFNVTIKGKRKKSLQDGDSAGIIKVFFSDGTYLYTASWLSGYGRNVDIETLVATERPVWTNFLKLIDADNNKAVKPKVGIFTTHIDGSGNVIYEPYKPQNTPVLHSSAKMLKEDMDYYFDNVPMFSRFGMPGVRKILLAGPPGTGKTSIAYEIARTLSKDKSIIFAADINVCYKHLHACSKHKVSTIVILEDVEGTFSRAGSSILNFLDGTLLPKCPQGAYVLMTTNHPERIEDRILKRPGRIDKVIKFGVLTDLNALYCAELYFKGILFKTKLPEKSKKDLFNIVRNMTGAEIKELAHATALSAAADLKDIDLDFIAEIKDKMRTDLSDVEDDDQGTFLIKKDEPARVGFIKPATSKEISFEELIQLEL